MPSAAKPMISNEKAFIDWCRFSFIISEDQDALDFFSDFIEAAFPGHGFLFVSTPGRFHYKHGAAVCMRVGRDLLTVASLSYGGHHQRDTAMIDAPGRGCAMVKDWTQPVELLDGIEARLTRVDTAVDFHEGQFSMLAAVRSYKRGEFMTGGTPPRARNQGDWTAHKGAGRTLYVGGRLSGKEARIYEKGKQLGDKESKWVRFEVEWLNRDRVLPLDILTDPARYFAGAYPVCSRIIKKAGERIKTQRLEFEYDEAALRGHLKRGYGKALYVLRGRAQTDEELLNELQTPGVPKRLEKSAIAGGIASNSKGNDHGNSNVGSTDHQHRIKGPASDDGSSDWQSGHDATPRGQLLHASADASSGRVLEAASA